MSRDSDPLSPTLAALRRREDELLAAVETGASADAWRDARRRFERLRALLLKPQRQPTAQVREALDALDGCFDRGAATVGLWDRDQITQNAEALRRLVDSARRRPSSEEVIVTGRPSTISAWPQPAAPSTAADDRRRCGAVGCDERIPPQLLLCSRHWPLVSRDVRQRVIRHYRIGQERRGDASAEYRAAAREAIRQIAELEGQALPPDVLA